jgi:hypothetical protein
VNSICFHRYDLVPEDAWSPCGRQVSSLAGPLGKIEPHSVLSPVAVEGERPVLVQVNIEWHATYGDNIVVRHVAVQRLSELRDQRTGQLRETRRAASRKHAVKDRLDRSTPVCPWDGKTPSRLG